MRCQKLRGANILYMGVRLDEKLSGVKILCVQWRHYPILKILPSINIVVLQ